MGFQDLKAFNLVLLAKQGWRLQTNTNSLVHKVFKARYFPNGDYLSAELGNHPSYAWRSILAAQSIVRQGHQWQVGNGQNLDIWNDKWLPQPSAFKLTANPLGVHTVPKCLFSSTLTRAWQTDMVRQYFSPNDVVSILGIPLSIRLHRDRMIWAYTSKGTFSVKSAYKVAMAVDSTGSLGESSSNQHQTRFFTI